MALVDDDIIILDDDDMEGADVVPHDSKKTCQLLSPEINGKKGEESKRKAGSMSTDNAKLFEEFVDYCTSLTQEHPEVITFLRGRLSKASPTFLSSVEFHNILSRCLTRVQKKRTKVYVYINELCTVLKANSSKRKINLSPANPKTPIENKVVASIEDGERKEEEASTSKKSGSKAQIRYLENLLHTFSREIQKLQEKELSLEELEDEDSSYIQESRLKRKLLRIFQKLCQLKGCSSLTGRAIEQKINYCGTRYPEINRRLQKFINETSDGFPDYGDVHRVIQKANEKDGLGLTAKQMEGMAQDAFRELGNRLQERRHLDLVFNFGSHLTDNYKPGFDPALQDPSLARRLRDNRGIAVSHLDNVIKKYADMQDEGEGEESRKIKQENERSPSSSRGGQNSWSRGRKVSSPSSQESEEDESVDSETDIEDELKQCEQLSNEEEGDVDAEPPAVDQDNGVDQDMEPATESSSSAEEDKEDEKEMNEDQIQHGEDKGEESGQKDVVDETIVKEHEKNESLIQSTLLSSHEKMSKIQEIKQELHPPHTSFCLPNQSKLKLSTIELQNNTTECGIQENSFSEKTRNCSELPENENSQAQPVEKEGLPHVANNVSCVREEVLCSATDNPAVMERTDTSTNRSPGDCSLQSDLSDLPKNTQNNFLPESKIRLKSVTQDKQIQNTEVDATLTQQVLECAAGLGTCIGNINSNKPIEKGHSTDGPVEHHELENKNAEKENDAICFIEMPPPKSCVFDGAQTNEELLHSDISNEAEFCEVSDVSHLSSKNGMTHVKKQKKTAKCLQSGTVSLIGPFSDSVKNVSKGASFTSKKRKKSLTQTSLKNGDGSFSGAEKERGKKIKRPRKSCTFDLDRSNHSSPEISLDLIVNCSPPESPCPVSNPCIKTHASTQCDPDEVIVLSD
ncbi:hypothetical protein XELAEV_18039132mg [Xenopus laevis]|uniref:Death domain-associated protein 6 n=1 Tax=Xenopus laevis TaxID=8355 RepID=A0A974C763_XENLA|nr:hypothetical protein XELAEV_18039132mg [Xenopus laevis]